MKCIAVYCSLWVILTVRLEPLLEGTKYLSFEIMWHLTLFLFYGTGECSSEYGQKSNDSHHYVVNFKPSYKEKNRVFIVPYWDASCVS